MASATKQTESIRKRKATKAGAKRKAKLRNSGTTKSAKDLFEDKD